MSQPMNELMSQPLNELLSQPLNELMSQPMNEPLSQPLNEPMSQPLNEPMSQPLRESFAGPVKMDTASQLSSQSSLTTSSQGINPRKRKTDCDLELSPKRQYQDGLGIDEDIQSLVRRTMFEIQKSHSSQDPPPDIAMTEVGTIVQKSHDIISGIAFNGDSSKFVTGGIDKLVRIYAWRDYSDAQNETDQSQPIWEGVNDSKISCVLFSKKSEIVYASSYDGYVRSYNIPSTQFNNLYRCPGKVWSIDTHAEQPDLLASACDGGIVSISDTRYIQKTKKFNSSIEFDGSATCVKFCNANELCVGVVDTYVRLYDIRNLFKPKLQWKVSKHTKPISYIATSGGNIVSSGIDSSLKCWTGEGEYVREYSQHINHRNFTGLACTDQLLAVGSEDNQVFIYDKEYSFPAGVYPLYSPTPHVFVTSVAFHRENNYLVAGNSIGHIAVIKLDSPMEQDPDLTI